MFCGSCGQEINPGQAVCLKCGVKVGEGTAYCANCGQQLQPGAAVCLGCGAPAKKAGGNLGGQDKVTMALICFFLGALGIHNFMMGETKKGVVKIVADVCFGLGALLALIDFIKILTDSYVVDPDKLI